ncbi:MAG: ATP-grasp domain-containing protein [Promethearchaeota archaeon]
MEFDNKSVLVVGFNTRPLAYSLEKSGYNVYVVDFFGDLDLYPCVKDSKILIKELNTNYSSIKDRYSELLADFTIQMMNEYPKINYLIIGSGLDDAYNDRERISNEIKERNYKIKDLNNNIKTIQKARDIEYIYNLLTFYGFNIPITHPYETIRSDMDNLYFPIILKKKRSAGGISVFKIKDIEEFLLKIKNFELKRFNPSEWMIQEYIEGIPISCTTISNGKNCAIISINRQILGNPNSHAPQEFMYCGNIVPAGLSRKDEQLIKKISTLIADNLGLKGINGFDYVLKDHYPYLMEINPRIPGSIRASETSLELNLLDLHIKSFNASGWNYVKKLIKKKKFSGVSTKIIIFAPKVIDKNLIAKINQLEFIHDKSEPTNNISKGEPLCTVLYKGTTLSESYSGAMEVVDKVNGIIE